MNYAPSLLTIFKPISWITLQLADPTDLFIGRIFGLLWLESLIFSVHLASLIFFSTAPFLIIYRSRLKKNLQQLRDLAPLEEERPTE